MFTGSFSPKTNDKPIVFSYLFFYYSLWSLDKTQGKINEVNHQLPIRCRVLRILRAGENFRVNIFSIWWKLATFYILMNCFRTISIHILKVENFRNIFKNFFGSFIGKKGVQKVILKGQALSDAGARQRKQVIWSGWRGRTSSTFSDQ